MSPRWSGRHKTTVQESSKPEKHHQLQPRERLGSIDLYASSWDLLPVTCLSVACKFVFQRKKSQGEKRKEEKRKTKSVRSDSFSSCYFCLNNFISALFPDKTKLSLTYHLAKHWSLKDEPSSFQLSASLRLWCFPQMGFRTQTIITNTPPTSVTALSTIFEARKFLGSYWECPWLLCRVVRLKIKSK